VPWDTFSGTKRLVFRVIVWGTRLAMRRAMFVLALFPTLVAVGIFTGVLRLRPGR
jgi:hypothetical protein